MTDDLIKSTGKFLNELNRDDIRKAVKSAERKVGARIKKNAEAQLIASGLGNADKMRKNVRLVTFSDVWGMKVTVKPVPGTSKGFHRNRQGNLKPVLAWAETGTDVRKTRKSGASRGRMRSYNIMPEESSQTAIVESTLWPEIQKAITNTAKKNGLI